LLVEVEQADARARICQQAAGFAFDLLGRAELTGRCAREQRVVGHGAPD
jgi:hypothetical protein